MATQGDGSDEAWSALSSAVGEEYARFEAKLPELLTTHAGQWVVFLGGVVRHATVVEHDAYEWAVHNLALEDAYVVARVEPIVPRLLSAALAFVPAGEPFVAPAAPLPVTRSEVVKEISTMAHYKDGTPAALGDTVRGRGYNLPYDVQGVVVGLTPGTGSCDIHLAVLTAGKPAGTVTIPMLTLTEEHGTCAQFELVHRPYWATPPFELTPPVEAPAAPEVLPADAPIA